MTLERLQIQITGHVQGVGFRPYVYRLAKQLQLSGWVQNTAEGIAIEVQGKSVSNFIHRLKENLPLLATVDSIQAKKVPIQLKETKFLINDSQYGFVTAKLLPDAGVCSDCINELFDPNSRFYHYPFINCNQCGPRLTITHNLPYDRAETSMSDFPLCSLCKAEYEDPNNRRYHVQSIACHQCGPEISLPIGEIARRIKSGEIVAMKGLGGYQIICDASNEEAILKLRQRKRRSAKPFAMMCLNIKSAMNIARISEEEKKQLMSRERPIVLLKKSNKKYLPECIAPDLLHFGIMLPYTPLHYLIFNALAGNPSDIEWIDSDQATILIVTSANVAEKPLIIDDETACAELKNIVDTVISYNRKIITRVDDSVIRVIDNTPFFIRRARGYVPKSIKLPYEIPSTLALGGYLKNTFCITRGDEAFVSQHIGNLKNVATIEFFHETLNQTIKFLNIQPTCIAHDLHPDFYTSQLAKKYNVPVFSIQHHHAHLASVSAEYNVKQPALGLALDGHGYGENGEAWGGELFLLENTEYKRLGHFQQLPLPGGDKAAHEPWRMAAAVLHLLGCHDEIRTRYSARSHVELLIEMLVKSVNSPLTSSCGRLFDAASALLGIQAISQYEGHAAMCLESLATNPTALLNGWEIKENTFSLLPTLKYLLQCNDTEGANIFHGTLILGLTKWIEEWALKTKISTILLSGGCFINRVLSEGLIAALIAKRLTPFLPQKLPPNDGGICLGQAWIAGRRNQCV